MTLQVVLYVKLFTLDQYARHNYIFFFVVGCSFIIDTVVHIDLILIIYQDIDEIIANKHMQW